MARHNACRALIVDKPAVCGRDYPAACLRTVPQFSMVVPLRSQARLWHSLLHWAYFGLFRAQRAAFVRPAYGSPVFRRCALRVLACSQFAMVALLRCRLQSSLAHWAYFGLFPPQAAAFVRPPAASRPPTGSDRDGNAFLRFAPPCASLARCSVPAHFVCSALQPFGPSLLRKKCQK